MEKICSTTHLIFRKISKIICHVSKEMDCWKHYARQGENPTPKSMLKVYLENNSSLSCIIKEAVKGYLINTIAKRSKI